MENSKQAHVRVCRKLNDFNSLRINEDLTPWMRAGPSPHSRGVNDPYEVMRCIVNLNPFARPNGIP